MSSGPISALEGLYFLSLRITFSIARLADCLVPGGNPEIFQSFARALRFDESVTRVRFLDCGGRLSRILFTIEAAVKFFKAILC